MQLTTIEKRHALGISQRQLSESLNISRGVIHKFENDENSVNISKQIEIRRYINDAYTKYLFDKLVERAASIQSDKLIITPTLNVDKIDCQIESKFIYSKIVFYPSILRFLSYTVGGIPIDYECAIAEFNEVNGLLNVLNLK